MSEKIKGTGQVYTPDWVVGTILDEVGYRGPGILGKRVLEPSSGDGQFLVEIARRVIETSPVEDLAANLECIHGWEIDESAVNRSIERLTALVSPLGVSVDWRVSRRDSLDYDAGDRFDFIVGNPPYVRIHNLSEATRDRLRSEFDFCASGMVDLYYAFFEIACDLVAPDGVCGYITPNSFLYNQGAKALRDHLSSRRMVRKIVNYGDKLIFEDASTYCAVTIFGPPSDADEFVYCKTSSDEAVRCRDLRFDDLIGKRWRLSVEDDQFEGTPLKDVCRIHTGLATLCDSVFIVDATPQDGLLVEIKTKGGTHTVERAILKPIIKASTFKKSTDPLRWVVFPYKNTDGKWVVLAEDELERDYPRTYDYLASHKDRLLARDRGKPKGYPWYAFGRTQGLNTSFGRKIVFSPMNDRPNFVVADREDATFYSGYCIKYDGDLARLAAQLNSERMSRFVMAGQRDFREGWKSYTKKGIEDFPVDTTYLEEN